MTTKEDTKIRADQFDECVSELSEEAQEFFAQAVADIANQLSGHAGVMSAKELIFQLMKFLETIQAGEIAQLK